MLAKILTRLALSALALLAVSALVFFGVAALPGDAATAALGQTATPELLAKYRLEFGLDRPLIDQYLDWLGGFFRGDLGQSLPSGDPVTKLISDKASNTLALTGLTLLVLVPLSLALGVISSIRRDGLFDHGVALATLGLLATPEFVVGTLLVVAFASWLSWLPPVSLIDGSEPLLSQLTLFVLPLLTLLAAALAQTVRMVRASMSEVLDSNYVEMARLKGVSESRVLLRHALPNAVGPTITVLAFNVGWLLGGVVVVESVFQFPGLGLAFSNAVSNRDLPTVQAITLLITATYIVVNLLADVLVMLLNPRLRRAAA